MAVKLEGETLIEPWPANSIDQYKRYKGLLPLVVAILMAALPAKGRRLFLKSKMASERQYESV